MDKFVIYCLASNQLMTDGGAPVIGTEKELKRILKDEVVDAKRYEVKPISFMKQWAKKEKQLETEKEALVYKFSPTYPEFHYKPQEGEQRYLLIVGEEGVKKSGRKVKDFASAEDAIKMATQSIVKLTKEFPQHAYYVLDLERYGYVSRIDQKGITKYSRFRASKSKLSQRSDKQC